eukprot:gnl/MRDRNA2_/MRDRNA2_136355_c0_seq1.p1 gnl/MRDRNA2_/MRDRNA2_136355_c0~~gnl/MRDRNA2_/MRDRNA2_136355_c0_seq1.p1  ORF type:complete len:594 (-),score=93.66 gnl/MRDRNA2_/MRDRNA2_136355_c0_seq1:17-1798(-)
MPKRAFGPDEDPCFLVRPSDNVYSFFMFIGPTESHKEGRGWTWDITIGYVLVGLNFTLQAILLYTIFNTVVVENVDWQDGIVKVGDSAWNLFAPKEAGCNDGGSLCFHDNGMYTCAPPSVQLTGRWDELDTNKDEIWSRDEAVAAKDTLKCKYAVNPVEVFDVFINFLVAREKLIWLHPDVKAGKAIHHEYFKYAMGDIIMCGYRTKDMCPNLMKRGFFHAPLKYETAPRVGNTIDSALEYCYHLLAPGGTCELFLPSTYSVWKIESVQQCGEASFAKFSYTNPGDGVKKSLLEVDYQARSDYELGMTTLFNAYKGIILFLWLLAMLVEFREIVMIGTLALHYPDAEQFGEEAVLEEQDPADPEDVRFRIQGITSGHRSAMKLLLVFRTTLTAVLTWVGGTFLLKQTDYIDLLLDGVALIFIVEIASMLYAQVLRDEVRDQTEDIYPMKVTMYGIEWLNRRPALVDIICIFSLMIGTYFILWNHRNTIVEPVLNALDCTCRSRGEHCMEAQKFDYDFWDHYWKEVVPAVFDNVEKLKSGGAGVATAVSYLHHNSVAEQHVAHAREGRHHHKNQEHHHGKQETHSHHHHAHPRL